MPALEKAFLQELDNANHPRSGKPPLRVQFNPASLRLQYSNQSEGGRSAGRQARQHTGEGSVTLSVDLHFDTADEGTTEAPRSVLEHTRRVEAFITPQASGSAKQAPPRLQFQWGEIIVKGVMESLAIELDHFAHNGAPLRAKASITIKSQDEEVEHNRRGAGANSVGAAAAAALQLALAALPGARPPRLPGTSGTAAALAGALSQVQALAGEGLAALAQRNGLAPEAWRALAAGVSDPLRLAAGQLVPLPAQAPSLQPLGERGGVQSGARDAAQRQGLAPAAGGGSALQSLQRGHALSEAGGLGAALESVKSDAAGQASAQARQRFASEGGRGGGALSVPAGQQVFSQRADARAQSWGRDVPLRDKLLVAQQARANLLSGQVLLRGGASTAVPPSTSDPGVPSWVALHADSSAPAATTSSPPHPPGCGCT